jgi:ABC-type Fe3+/spermidine/putrescine transport system ATPase subunit
LSVSTEHILKPNETVYLAIRPEKIRTRPEGPENIVEGTVEEAVFAGPIVLYVVDIGGENITATFSSVGHRSIPKRGAQVKIQLRPEDCFVLSRR